ncbi:MAG: hypothetical protein EOM26_11255 [Alphaproteobacteria bacterium]|nr:hypothetical protein [Alphaproteobacteria bacterium]
MQKFSNNATTSLTADITGAATSITVADSSAFATLAAGDDELVTIESGGAREILSVTARAGDTWTVARAREGTIAQAWSAGALVEARLTAETLGGMTSLISLMAYNAPGGAAIGVDAVSMQPSRTSATRVASGVASIAIGKSAQCSGEYSVSLGSGAECSGDYSIAFGVGVVAAGGYCIAFGTGSSADEISAIAIGTGSSASGAASTAIGKNAIASNSSSIAIGDSSSSESDSGIAAGVESLVESEGSVCIGKLTWSSDAAAFSTCVGIDAYSEAPSGVAVGNYAYANAQSAVALGHDSTAAGESSIAIGRNAVTTTDHVAHIAALQCHVKPSNLVAPESSARAWRTATLSAPVVTLMSESISLASTASTVDLVIPPNTRFFVDTVGIIIDTSGSPIGTPQISITNVLTAEDVTATALWSRQLWKDRDSAGLAGTISITVPTALTSGTLTARVYLTGLSVQV